VKVILPISMSMMDEQEYLRFNLIPLNNFLKILSRKHIKYFLTILNIGLGIMLPSEKNIVGKMPTLRLPKNL
jgi:hypothetical protein